MFSIETFMWRSVWYNDKFSYLQMFGSGRNARDVQAEAPWRASRAVNALAEELVRLPRVRARGAPQHYNPQGEGGHGEADAAALSVRRSRCSCSWRKFRAAAGRSQRAPLAELGARPASPDAGRCARTARGRARETSDGMIEKVLGDTFSFSLLHHQYHKMITIITSKSFYVIISTFNLLLCHHFDFYLHKIILMT